MSDGTEILKTCLVGGNLKMVDSQVWANIYFLDTTLASAVVFIDIRTLKFLLIFGRFLIFLMYKRGTFLCILMTWHWKLFLPQLLLNYCIRVVQLWMWMLFVNVQFNYIAVVCGSYCLWHGHYSALLFAKAAHAPLGDDNSALHACLKNDNPSGTLDFLLSLPAFHRLAGLSVWWAMLLWSWSLPLCYKALKWNSFRTQSVLFLFSAVPGGRTLEGCVVSSGPPARVDTCGQSIHLSA